MPTVLRAESGSGFDPIPCRRYCIFPSLRGGQPLVSCGRSVSWTGSDNLLYRVLMGFLTYRLFSLQVRSRTDPSTHLQAVT